MPTVIDSLLVTLGMDASNFKKGANDTAKAQKKLSVQSSESAKGIEKQEKALAAAQAARAKDLEARSKQIAQGLAKVRNEALGLFALFTAGMGIKNFAISTINAGASMGKLADNLGMATEKLAAYQMANKDAGGSAEGMTAQLKESADEIARMKTFGSYSDSQRAFLLAGGDVSAFKDGNTYLEARADILDRIYNKEKNPTKAGVVASSMGISDDTYNLLKQGSGLIAQQVAEREKLAKFSREDAENSDKARKQMLEITRQFERITTKLILELAPSLTTFANSINKLLGISENKQEVKGAGVTHFMGMKFGKKSDLDAEAALNGKKPLDGSSVSRNRQSWSGKITGQESGGNRKDYLLAKLKADGYSDAQAAGMVGSLMQESNLDHTAVNPKSGATGIAQWLGPRKAQFASKYGHDLSKSTFEEQTDFMLWELRNTEKKAGNSLRRAPNAAEAARIHSQEYERPGAAEANIAKRQANAMAIVNMPSGARASMPVTNNGGNTSTSDIKISAINVQTQATDANGIARSIGSAVRNYGFVSQANTGLS